MQQKKTVTDLWKVVELGEGMIMSVADETNRYFGDYHRVCLRTILRCPLAAEDGPEQVVLEKTLVQMAVPSEGVERVRQDLFDRYIEHSAHYLRIDGFAERLWRKQRAAGNRKIYG